MSMPDHRAPLGRGLSARILALTVLFVLLGEMLIFVPSIARFRLDYLEDHLARAHLATIAIDREAGVELPMPLEDALLTHSGALAITIRDPDPALRLGHVGRVDRVFHLGEASWLDLVLDAFDTLYWRGERIVRVIGPSPMEAGTEVDVILAEAPLWLEMVEFGYRILALTAVLSVIVALLIFVSLRRLIVMPLRSIAEQLVEFRARPEDVSAERQPMQRRDEIGIVDRELHRMQQDIRQALLQKTRLAALGEAVSRINHDLRNLLSSAVLVSDRLESSEDPKVRAALPRLVEALERASRLCQETLNFARSRPSPPKLERLRPREMVDALAAERAPAIEIVNDIPPALEILADRDQLHRVLLNLLRNAETAMDGEGRLHFAAGRASGGEVVIDVTDTGSGIPEKAQERLFEPFSSSTGKGGSGLGLAICREILRSHGGDIELLSTGEKGTTFRLRLPRRVALAQAA